MPIWLILGLCIAWIAAPARAADLKTAARLVVSAEVVKPGDTLWAGVHLRMAPRWHTYWRNPGDSGMATTITWTLPPGWKAGEIHWPPPEAHVAADMTTYVYYRETVLLVPIEVSASAASGRAELKAAVAWLECDESCVPGDAELLTTVTVGPESKPSKDADLIQTWRNRVPARLPGLKVAAELAPTSTATTDLIIQGDSPDGFKPADFYPYPNDGYEIAAARPGTNAASASGSGFVLVKSIKRLAPAFPQTIAGLLVQPAQGDQPRRVYEATLTLSTAAAAPAAAGAAAGTLLAMLGFAFLGGLILNVMPCVLPVIALKVLGFVQQSKEDPRRVFRLGWIYALGVVVSFLGLAAMIIAVQKAGGAASWGMQMQNPHFRLALTVIVLLVALNLFGLFEITLGGRAMGAAAGLASKEGSAGAFFNGVLAVALATPCTAPFLTVALGFAFTQAPWVIGLMFAATGLGLAAPYVVLSWRPQWLKFLPKPGLWMLRFKIAMGFPMLATSVWLFDLTAPSFGDSGGLWLGLFLVLLALAAWIWGEFVQRGTRGRVAARAVALVTIVLAYALILEGQLQWRHPRGRSTPSGAVQESSDGIVWLPWSPEAVAKARAEGRPVLVDFTARWCLTCQSNKRLAIDIPDVRSKLREIHAVTLRADNTDPSPAIAAELKRYQRAGVPLVLVFPKAAERPAQVLPTLLTPGLVLDALKQAVE